jgi:DNA-directed RNA polymerase specialized sigma24 family protein
MVGGFTIEEIATILGKPAGAIKALQRRALGALRRDELMVVSP